MSKKDNDKKEVEVLDDEKELVLDHNYDGIKELDHPLPAWWVFIFIATIVFAIPYYFYYTHASGPSIRDEMKEELAKIYKIQDEYEAKQGGFNIDKYNQFIITEQAKKLGKMVFNASCAACHGQKGQGGIGPNLTDKYWLHGEGKLAGVFEVIKNGVGAKGMPAWKQSLNEDEMMAVTDYVLKFKQRYVEGKEPQGELVE